MGVKLSIEKQETPAKAALKTAGVFLFALLCLLIAMLVTLALAHLARFGINESSLKALEAYWTRIENNPPLLLTFYGNWWEIFTSELVQGRWHHAVLWLPLLAPVLFAAILLLAFVRSSYSFSLWYVLNHHFARLDDIEKMGLTRGINLVLGQFQEHILGISKPSAILCFGEAGSGKTSSVAIPSILRSDNCSIIAMDNSGTLAKYTSGYRATLGPVYYFNWDLQDDPDKGSYYPRWNPLAPGNLPPKGDYRDDYLNFLAGFLISYDTRTTKDNYWEWLACTALYGFLQFLTDKISQAEANDYFLNQILEKGRLTKEDKDTLLSYYALMPELYGRQAMEKIKRDKLSVDDYFPIGSWEGIPEVWQGKELSLSMLTDWLMYHYLESRTVNAQSADWKDWLETLLVEARLFNYCREAFTGLQSVTYLSRKQRQIMLPMVLKPLKIFRNPMVRERTSGNDFCLGELRGVKNYATKNWEPVTIYCTANTKSTKFISRLFTEIMLRRNLSDYKFKGPFPLLAVLEDVGQMLEVKTLGEAVSKGPRHKLSVLMLCNSLHNLEMIYGKEALENLVANTNYKIVMGEDNRRLSRQLDKLAAFATRSVQIPADNSRKWLRVKKGHADANYYHRIARKLLARRNLSIATRGWQVLLAEGYYHRPVLTKSLHFLADEKFKEKALMGTSYLLKDEILKRRNRQDDIVPGGEDFLYSEVAGIGDEAELDMYMSSVYDQVIDKVQQSPDRKSVLADEISSRWATADSKTATGAHGGRTEDTEGDWWLKEGAFAGEKESTAVNPFAKK